MQAKKLTTIATSTLIKLFISLLFVSALSDCASTRDRVSQLRDKNQTSIYSARNYRNSYMRLDWNLIHQDSQLKYRSELDNNPFGRQTWSRNCDCH